MCMLLATPGKRLAGQSGLQQASSKAAGLVAAFCANSVKPCCATLYLRLATLLLQAVAVPMDAVSPEVSRATISGASAGTGSTTLAGMSW